MGKKVCIIAEIDDKAFDILYGGRNGHVLVKPYEDQAPRVPGVKYPLFQVNLIDDDISRMYHADALGLCLLSEKQYKSALAILKLHTEGNTHSEFDNDTFFTTKE